MTDGYVTGIALNEDDEIIGYQFVNFGKMMDFIKAGDEPAVALEKQKDSMDVLTMLLRSLTREKSKEDYFNGII